MSIRSQAKSQAKNRRRYIKHLKKLIKRTERSVALFSFIPEEQVTVFVRDGTMTLAELRQQLVDLEK